MFNMHKLVDRNFDDSVTILTNFAKIEALKILKHKK